MTTPDDGASFFDAEMGRFLSQFEADIQPLEELQERVKAVRGRGEAADGLVRAEVQASGALCGLRIDPRAMRLGADALAEAVLAAASDAAADLTTQMAGMMTDGLTPFADGMRRFNED
ncbi:YbaB/EbfC family nucleoid-associated protein [Nonomuraea rhodomycinica]|uniref:YbaB/EbfC family nucleoid-associated protein n=1 Tax=Nonomuraea rhodomycinica TaxID=1712872 RepID=A0A7Y6IN08_9ACTN|nr:YbaB/EbfC family nucleoid-associated protein [Nonomuraea rhodomycinica]NUW40825.1 YbaB/EbfC family nucleoid-associated protein [Nonomuraea rhodomycinica]